MSRIFGPVHQLGYVVHDIEAALKHWVDVLGVGPWFYVDRLPTQNYRVRGTPCDPHISIALANSGPMQIELIQQRCATPTLYTEFLASGPEGLQHVCTWPGDYQATLARALKAGHRVGQEGASNRGAFVYLETDGAHRGTCVELADMTPLRRRQFGAIAEAAVGWDGRDPVRTRWPD